MCACTAQVIRYSDETGIKLYSGLLSQVESAVIYRPCLENKLCTQCETHSSINTFLRKQSETHICLNKKERKKGI